MHVSRTGVFQRADSADLGAGRAEELRLRRGAVDVEEQVVGAAPHRVQRVRVGVAAVGGQVGIDLVGDRRRERVGGAGGKPGPGTTVAPPAA